MQLTSAKSGPERPPKRPLTLSNIRPGEARPMPLTSAKSGPERPPKRPSNTANLVQHPAGKGRPMPLTPSNIRPGGAAQCR